jgi:hypothetical protein
MAVVSDPLAKAMACTKSTILIFLCRSRVHPDPSFLSGIYYHILATAKHYTLPQTHLLLLLVRELSYCLSASQNAALLAVAESTSWPLLQQEVQLRLLVTPGNTKKQQQQQDE